MNKAPECSDSRSMPASTALSLRSSLAVNQEFGEGATFRVAPELSDPVGSLKVGKDEDMDQFGAGSRPEGVEALPQSLLKLIRTHVTGD